MVLTLMCGKTALTGITGGALQKEKTGFVCLRMEEKERKKAIINNLIEALQVIDIDNNDITLECESITDDVVCTGDIYRIKDKIGYSYKITVKKK